MRKKLIISMMFLMMFVLVGCNFIEQVQQPVTNQPPKANFTFTPAVPKVNEVVSFNPSNSSDLHDSINQLLVRWDFDGDGNWEIDYSAGKTAAQIVTFSYDVAQKYTIVLEVRDTQGVTQQTTKTITVEDVEEGSTTSYTIAGNIVESRGGHGIGGALVKLLSNTGATYTTTTGANGEFNFAVSELGPYDLTVTKSGYASSRVQNMVAGQSYSTTLDLPLRKYVVSGWSTNPPQIVLTGLGNGSITSLLSYIINVQGDLPIQLGKVQYGPQGHTDYENSFEEAPAQMFIDPASLPNGDTYIRVSVYDINENLTEYYQQISIQGQTTVPVLPVPAIYSLTAFTTGKSVELLSESAKNRIKTKLGDQSAWDQFQTAAIQTDATLLTELKWDQLDDSNVAGYKVYRSMTSASQDFTLIGVVNDPYRNDFIDTSSVLTPGQPVYYRISSYGASGESAMSEIISTTPLEPFRVSLVSPAKDAVVTTSEPVFTWTYDHLVGDDQYYSLLVTGVTDSGTAIQSWEHNTTSSQYYFGSLETGKEYEWNLDEVYAETIYSNMSSAISFSNNDWMAMNGWYRFRTEF